MGLRRTFVARSVLGLALACSGRSDELTSPGNTGGTSGAGGRGGTDAGGTPSSVPDAGAPDAAAEVPEPLPRVPALDTRFSKITLHREFSCEGASFGDFNADGITDVVAGPDWFEGPGFGARHPIFPRVLADPLGYSDCFFEFVHDFDGDGRSDVFVVGFPGNRASWYENPGTLDVPWPRHEVIDTPVDNESPAFADITGDGEPELVHMSGGVFGWSAPGADVRSPWTFHPLSEPRDYATFTHGLGVGDLDGDGLSDALEATGYFLQPSTPGALFTRVEQPFGAGGAQMVTLDVDGDGDSDVVSSLAAHGYGLAWYEQIARDPTPRFSEHVIVPNAEPAVGESVVLHEPHALALADIDGDGLADIVTGERFWGHVPAGMPEFSAPARLYWFRTERTPDGAVFHPTLIDDDSGVGTQLTTGDVDADGRTDLVIANKKGAFVFLRSGAR
jgi:VCBS repeat protein/FG-GAP repeat protein